MVSPFRSKATVAGTYDKMEGQLVVINMTKGRSFFFTDRLSGTSLSPISFSYVFSTFRCMFLCYLTSSLSLASSALACNPFQTSTVKNVLSRPVRYWITSLNVHATRSETAPMRNLFNWRNCFVVLALLAFVCVSGLESAMDGRKGQMDYIRVAYCTS
jgi:hypothetical protein